MQIAKKLFLKSPETISTTLKVKKSKKKKELRKKNSLLNTDEQTKLSLYQGSKKIRNNQGRFQDSVKRQIFKMEILLLLFFWLSLNFLNIMLEVGWDFLNSFLNFYLFISFNCYLVRFNTNNKRHFLGYRLTYVSSFTTYICFSMFTKEVGTTNNNEHRKEFQVQKSAKIYSIL